ncbi:MAG: hypothetical protein L6Q98_07435 [Anaerolineae bacterium]|nr:hypothetical protein [Anaerolineae bacterium]NUQ04663.1 hypothetical protein [Anaerolineae bacterium]
MQQVTSSVIPEPRAQPLATGSFEVDAHLPVWARRTNPIVRRHLGTAWKTFLPNVSLLVRLYALQAAVMCASLFLPGLLTLLMPTVTVSLVLLPVGVIMFAQILIESGSAAATFVVDERRNDTLPLTLLIPHPILHIIYAKMSAALWRHVENLMLMSLAVVLFSMPLMIIQYDVQFHIDSAPVLVRLSLLGGLAVSILRLWIEPVMVTALAAMYGAGSRSRVQAITATLLTAGAYFLAINLARVLPVEGVWRLLIETVLPLILPLIITAAALRYSILLLTED